MTNLRPMHSGSLYQRHLGWTLPRRVTGILAVINRNLYFPRTELVRWPFSFIFLTTNLTATHLSIIIPSHPTKTEISESYPVEMNHSREYLQL